MASAAGSGLRFRLAGFDVSVPLNTLLGVGLIAWLWLPSFSGRSPAGQWASAIVFAVVLIASVLVHELAHAVAARRFGFPVIGITLWAFGGFTSYRPVRNTPTREAVIAASGPAATLVVAFVAWSAWALLPDDSSVVADVLGAVALANALIGVFNMLPGLPLDGGGVLSAGVWAITGSRIRGQRFAAYAGMVLAGLIVAAPLILSLRTGASADLGLVVLSAVVAAFLFVGARGALRNADLAEKVQGRSAGDLAVRAVVVPPSEPLTTLDALISGASRDGGAVALVGDPSTGLQGYVLPPASAAVPAAARPSTTVASVTRTVEQWGWLPASADAEEALELLASTGAPVVVTDPYGRPVGVIVSQPAAGL